MGGSPHTDCLGLKAIKSQEEHTSDVFSVSVQYPSNPSFRNSYKAAEPRISEICSYQLDCLLCTFVFICNITTTCVAVEFPFPCLNELLLLNGQ